MATGISLENSVVGRQIIWSAFLGSTAGVSVMVKVLNGGPWITQDSSSNVA